MQFRIADTFTASLSRLTRDEQRHVKTTAFDLQMNPVSTGMSLHKLDRAQDANFWSVRVSRDIRIIVHKTADSLLLCYVDHHDDAYRWAERRKLTIHPTTGAAQLVEIRETVQEVVVPSYVPTAQPARRLFERFTSDDLLRYGVPGEWLDDVRAATEDTLFTITPHLPAEASEALLELAVGNTPPRPPKAAPSGNPFEHPDALRRFRAMADIEELRRALDAPWDQWAVFLHPEQRATVERSYNGPARVAGSAGTGKTVVALHRAVALARRDRDARVLLTTFAPILANALRERLRVLVSEEREPELFSRIEVDTLDTVAQRLYRARLGKPQIASDATIVALLHDASASVTGHNFSEAFLRDEWTQLVDAFQLGSWEVYRDAPRLGRKTRLPERQRAIVWEIMSWVQASLAARGERTIAGVYHTLARDASLRDAPPYQFAVVDEAQDIGAQQLALLAAIGGDRPDALFFAGDLGQRIFQSPFSWKQQGVNVQGRATTLRVNYRTSHQIRSHADRLLGREVLDMDGIGVRRDTTVSLFNGPAPLVQIVVDAAEEAREVGVWLAARHAAGIAANQIGVFVRSEAQFDRARAAIAAAGLASNQIATEGVAGSGVQIGSMHLAKGLEFRAVAVIGCDEDVIPSAERLASAGDDVERREIFDTERHLLYVACTRARDELLICGIAPASEFLADLRRK